MGRQHFSGRAGWVTREEGPAQEQSYNISRKKEEREGAVNWPTGPPQPKKKGGKKRKKSFNFLIYLMGVKSQKEKKREEKGEELLSESLL